MIRVNRQYLFIELDRRIDPPGLVQAKCLTKQIIRRGLLIHGISQSVTDPPVY